MIVRGHSRMKKSVSTTGFIRTMDRSCTAGLCSSLRAPGKMSVWQVLPATVQSLELASWQIDWLCFKVSRHLTDNVVNNVANSWSPAVRHPLGRLSSYAGGNMWELSWDAQPGMGLMCAKISGGMENTRTPSNSRHPWSLGRLGSISLQGRSLLRWHLHSDLPGLRGYSH